MTKRRFSILFLAAVTLLSLCACGRTTLDSSAPEGLQTFGAQVNPSAQPSMAQEVAPNVTSIGTTDGEPEQNEQGESVSPSPSQATTTGGGTTAKPSATAIPTKKPSNTTQPTTAPTTSPSITPPQPATTATYDEVKQYVGKQLSELVDALGYPVRSDYDYVDEDDPTQGEIGTFYFSGGFTVTTLRNSDGEVITGITQE